MIAAALSLAALGIEHHGMPRAGLPMRGVASSRPAEFGLPLAALTQQRAARVEARGGRRGAGVRAELGAQQIGGIRSASPRCATSGRENARRRGGCAPIGNVRRFS